MSAISHKSLIAPLFEAVSSRSSQNLNADIFTLAMVDPSSGETDLFFNKKFEINSELLGVIKLIVSDFWRVDRLKNIKTVAREAKGRNRDKLGQLIVESFNCSNVLMSPFELEESGSGVLIWAWRNNQSNYMDILIEKAKLITEQIKLSLKLALREQKGQELSAKLAALLELSTAIYSSLNYTDVLEKAIHLSTEIIGADGGSIFILDSEDNLLKPLVTIDKTHEEEISKVTLHLGEGLTGLVAQSGVGLISNHSADDPRAFQVPGTPIDPESIISAPLTWSGQVIGAITLRSYNGKQFQQEDLDVLTIFARQTADAIENAKLFESLEKAYRELSNTQEQLVMTEKLRALGEMAGGVAHDFNNVLGAILGRTQLLLREVENTEWAEYLKQIEQVTLAGARTVRKLQNFTRVSSGEQFEQVDINHVVADAIETTKPRWKDECQLQGINIDMRFGRGEVEPVAGNKIEMVEAVTNLILNAVDALENGGYIEISTNMVEDRAVIKVEDNGVGMADTTVNRIFYPFFTTKGTKSTGMGLAVVYGIVTRHNGEIDVKSKLGEGTTCIITFPTTCKMKPDAQKPQHAIGDTKARILVIDDDDNIRDVMADMLEFLDHSVTQAPSGEKGIEIFKNDDFDLVITDLGMPGISGWEVTRICKSLKPQVPVMMVSGWGNQLDEKLVEQSGLDAIMSKPFEMNKMKNSIQQILARGQNKAAKPITES